MTADAVTSLCIFDFHKSRPWFLPFFVMNFIVPIYIQRKQWGQRALRPCQRKKKRRKAAMCSMLCTWASDADRGSTCADVLCCLIDVRPTTTGLEVSTVVRKTGLDHSRRPGFIHADMCRWNSLKTTSRMALSRVHTSPPSRSLILQN